MLEYHVFRMVGAKLMVILFQSVMVSDTPCMGLTWHGHCVTHVVHSFVRSVGRFGSVQLALSLSLHFIGGVVTTTIQPHSRAFMNLPSVDERSINANESVRRQSHSGLWWVHLICCLGLVFFAGLGRRVVLSRMQDCGTSRSSVSEVIGPKLWMVENLEPREKFPWVQTWVGNGFMFVKVDN